MNPNDSPVSNDNIEKVKKEMKLSGLFAEGQTDVIVQAIIALTSEPEKPWPQHGDTYYEIDAGGLVKETRYAKDPLDNYNMRSCNIFRTEAEAIAHRDSILSGDLIVKYVKRGE